LTRLSCIAILWAAAGFGSWMLNQGVGVAGVFLGMVSGADLYWSLGKRAKRFWLLLLLGMVGIPFGLLYEYLVSTAAAWPSLVKVLVFGAIVGGMFGLLSTGLGRLFGINRPHETRA
jgi:hypothetical protein